ncbi:Xbp1p [Saccharomyces eubayanus]|uniref:Xbp1p n=1 Tax=Saccharomyces eubayanus TaxID=1080349 RepID=UPI0006C601CA|nr:XBP1-like protein [Saccharomyces eubayanus]KOG98802.1 XBP1-like protein [Saccharomyces eubayanus]
MYIYVYIFILKTRAYPHTPRSLTEYIYIYKFIYSYILAFREVVHFCLFLFCHSPPPFFRNSKTTDGFHNMKYPAFSIDTDTVCLSDSPLDDYQRLYLVSVLDRNSPPASFSSGLSIKKANYKSSIAAQFTHPNFIVRPQNATEGGEDGRPPQNVLNCFEYQFPNLQTIQSPLHEQELFAQLSSSNAAAAATASHPPLHLHGKNVLMGKIILAASRANRTPVSASPIKQERKSLSAASRENGPSSLTKNQQFKLTKMDHNLINDKLINPNNCVIWSHDSGYVFMTGIWRLYQDVMKGLINLPRKDAAAASQQQFLCKAEFEKILSFCFYNHNSFPSDDSSNLLLSSTSASPPKRRKSTGSAFLDPGSSSSATPSAQANNYIDFHWNNIKPELRDFICQSYKDFLIDELGPDQLDLPNLNPANFTKRIRGGYIKIQGTWLPMEISRLLCLRFCFPIRYLLVPIFGPEFPRDCEAWYLAHQNVTVTTPTTSAMAKPKQKPRPRPRQRSTSMSHSKAQKLVIEDALPSFDSFVENLGLSSSDKNFIKKKNKRQKSSTYSSPSTSPIGPKDPTVQILSNLASFYNTHGHRYSYPGNIYIPQQKYPLPASGQLSSPQGQQNYTYDHTHPVPSQYQSPRQYNIPSSPIAPAPPTFPHPYSDDHYHFLKYANEVYKQRNYQAANNTNANTDTTSSPKANNSLNNLKFKTNSKQ